MLHRESIAYADNGYVPLLGFRFPNSSLRVTAVLLVGVLLVLSFLPSHIKVLLHTRGPLHGWAHLYLFAAIAVCFLEEARSFRLRCIRASELIVLGFLIEFAQGRANPFAIELQDIAVDAVGVACGFVIAIFRAGATSAPLPLQGSLLE